MNIFYNQVKLKREEKQAVQSIKFLTLMFLILSCANYRQDNQDHLITKNIARDSIHSGDIKAEAKKTITTHEVCFEVNLKLFGTTKTQAMPTNWTMAWIDQNNQYRLLSLNQRNPASGPQGGMLISNFGTRQEWSNTFKACGSKKEHDEVRGIVLNPKSLPFKTDRGLKLNW